MKKILVPTDFSENSIDALHYARAILELSGGTLYIVSAYEKPYTSRSAIRSLRDKLQEQAETKMEALRERLRSEPSEVPFEAYVREKGTIELILDAAEHFEVDMIVMGTKGASGVESALIGSNTAAIVERAKLPVLAVPRNAFFFGFKRVTFATDLGEGSRNAARRLLKLTAPFNSIIDLLNVFPSGDVAPVNGLESMAEKLRGEFEGREINNFLMANDSVQEGMVEHISAHPSEAVVMLTRRRTLFQKLFGRGLTRKMTLEGDLPVLAMH